MISVRPEIPGDTVSIRYVNEQAFGRTAEAAIVDQLRNRNALTLSLVTTEDDKIVGHIAFTQVTIESDDASFGAITLAPLAVLPAYQRKGIGSRLVRDGLEECRRLGQEIVVLAGHPDYYPRFGFLPARPKGIECEFAAPDKAWMILELTEGKLAGRTGTVRFPPEFREGV
ncbi:GNAT family N-acetyltransferase [Chloroflexota bacterium]